MDEKANASRKRKRHRVEGRSVRVDEKANASRKRKRHRVEGRSVRVDEKALPFQWFSRNASRNP